jgi:lipoate-protein ligase B
MTIKWSFLGLTPYEKALALQLDLRNQLLEGSAVDFLLLLSHPPVVTRGYSERGDAGLLQPRETFAAEGIQIVDVDRGGKTTYHGPDQLVGYFIFNLNRREIKPRDFVESVGQTLVEVLDSYGIEAVYNQADPGVEVDGKKIAFLGFSIHKGISMHGFSLNMGRDLKPFSYIVPCGKEGRRITSMEELTGTGYSIFDLYWRVVTVIGQDFEDEMEEIIAD